MTTLISNSPATSQATACWMEHQILEHIKGALRVTVDWEAPVVSVARKKSSVRFAFQSFCRHLERMMDIEEEDGYLLEVPQEKPYLSDRVIRLLEDHVRFRLQITELSPELEALPDWKETEFELLCDKIRTLLDDVDRHDHEEVDLLQETLGYDEGGEG